MFGFIYGGAGLVATVVNVICLRGCDLCLRLGVVNSNTRLSGVVDIVSASL